MAVTDLCHLRLDPFALQLLNSVMSGVVAVEINKAISCDNKAEKRFTLKKRKRQIV